jgi:type I restriction enzyme R subunit
MNKNEAFSRVIIDARLTDQEWNIQDTNSVRYEYPLPDGTRADYVLCDRHGRAMAVIEAKRFSINPGDAAGQAKAYAQQLGIPYVFLANGREVRFWEWENEAYPRLVKTFFKQDDLERRFATRQVRRDVMGIAIDTRIAGRDYQQACIDTLCREIGQGRRKLLVEMATGTGKTRTAAALIKRLFEANAITRVLFLVDRIPLAKQTEDAFAEHLPDYPTYVLRAGRRFQDEKLITITTLQSMVNIYADYSSGYFDLIISDECHRSIYGKWSGVLKHFDGVQIGLTATPCVTNLDDMAPDEEDKLFVRDTLRFFEVDKPTFSYKLKDAIHDGYLVPYQIYKAQTVKTAAEGGFEVKKDELDWMAMDAATRAEFEQLFKDTDRIVVDPNALERRFTIPERNRAMVREFRQVLEKGYLDHKGVLRKPLLGKTIVFAVTKRHAATLAELLDTEFADKKSDPSVRYADYVVSGLGPDDTVDGMTKIRRFKKEAFPQILVSVNMLDTGFDCPEVVNLVFARFTRSAILYQQMRGRGTRKAANKPIFTLFDFVGVADYHGDDAEFAEGGIVKESLKKKKYEPRRLLALDINDHIDPTTREWITVDDNGNMVFPEASEQKAAELGARFEAWLLEQTNLTLEQERWLRLLGSQIRANADSLDEVMPEHFAYFHTFSQMGGLHEARRIYGGAAHLESLLESLNAAVFGGEERPSIPGDTQPEAHH